MSSVLLEWSRLKDVLLVHLKAIPDTLNHGKETQTAIQWSSSIFLVQLDKTREAKVTAHLESTFCRCKMGFTGLHDFYGSWHLNICRFLFGLSTFLSLHSCWWRHFVLCCKEKLEPLDHVYRAMANFEKSWVCMISDFRCYLPVASLFWLISIANYVFFKSLSICLLRDKIWHLLWTCCLLAFYTVNGCVCKSSLSRVSYLPPYVFLRRRRSITSRKLHSCVEKSLCFSYTIWSSLCLFSSMCRLIPPLIVLVTQDSNGKSVDCVACCEYAIVWLCSGRTMVSIFLVASVAGISKALFTSR